MEMINSIKLKLECPDHDRLNSISLKYIDCINIKDSVFSNGVRNTYNSYPTLDLVSFSNSVGKNLLYFKSVILADEVYHKFKSFVNSNVITIKDIVIENNMIYGVIDRSNWGAIDDYIEYLSSKYPVNGSIEPRVELFKLNPDTDNSELIKELNILSEFKYKVTKLIFGSTDLLHEFNL